jgi:hypothetical protein
MFTGWIVESETFCSMLYVQLKVSNEELFTHTALYSKYFSTWIWQGREQKGNIFMPFPK